MAYASTSSTLLKPPRPVMPVTQQQAQQQTQPPQAQPQLPQAPAAPPAPNSLQPPQPEFPSPYQKTGIKGAPIPGQTTGPRNAAEVTSQPTGPPVPGPTAPSPSMPGKPAGVSDRAWNSFNSINSNISLEQWQAWDQYADPRCPPNMPYRSQKTIGGQPNNACAETPDNCPEGYQAYGRNECRTTQEVASLTGHAGGTGNGPTGIQGGYGNGPGGFHNAENDFLWQQLMEDLKKGSRFSPEVMASLLGETKLGAEQASNAQLEQSNADLATRGVARSGFAADQAREIRANASNQVLAARNQILRAKVDADFQDHKSTLDAMQAWLNNSRQQVLQWNATQAQKEVALAQIELGYQQLQQQFDILREEYSQKLALAGLQL